MDVRGIVDLPPGEPDNLAHQLGNTPMEPIYLVIGGVPRKIHLKLESENPTGSVKARTGYGLIQALEAQGLLSRGATLIESTSGNLGVALSFFCKVKGYGFIAVIDPKTTQENSAKMQALGAQIEMVHQPDENGGYLLSRLERVRELCHVSPTYVWTDQYSNPANPRIHYLSTAPEIYRQCMGGWMRCLSPYRQAERWLGSDSFFGRSADQQLLLESTPMGRSYLALLLRRVN